MPPRPATRGPAKGSSAPASRVAAGRVGPLAAERRGSGLASVLARCVLVLAGLVALAACGSGAEEGVVVAEDTFNPILEVDTVGFDGWGPADGSPVPDASEDDTASPVDTQPSPDAVHDTASVPDTPPAEDTSAAPDAGPTDTGPADSGGADASDTSAADVGADAPGPDTAEPPPTNPWGVPCLGPGGDGCSCASSAECALGLTCADTLLGSFCAEPCLSTCAGERRCVMATPQFAICLPAWSTLCAPCREDAECLELGARCLDHGAAGAYCAAPCGGAGACPEGFTCEGAGEGPGLCVPLEGGGGCHCSATATALGAATSCFVEGGEDCLGERRCEDGLLTECDVGPLLPEELCNGKDDTCDGQIDTGFPVGEPCLGEAGCGGGVYVCAPDGLGVVCEGAGVPVAERCNGLDDDCDGIVDNGCDDDGDGWCDADMEYWGSPLCPHGGGDCDDDDPTVHPGAPEVCDGKDNNCDGVTDGMVEPCAGGCGAGTSTCTAGVWGPCTGGSGVCDPASPCCRSDGCAFEPTSVRCGGAPVATERQCQGSCGGSVRERQRWAYCGGASASCGGDNLVWEAWQVVQSCGAGHLCAGSGGASACQACSHGCASGQCVSEPLRTICLDPAYGGGSPGPVHHGLVGADVTWSIAAHLRDWLEADTAAPHHGGRWQVVMTRTQAGGPTQSQRVATCNAAASDRVLSVGVNACCGDAASGTETFRAAMSSPITQAWAEHVQSRAVAILGLNDRGVKTHASRAILHDTHAPAAWLLPGFLDNSGDAALLGSDATRRALALALLHAVQASFGLAPYTPP